MRTWFFEIRLTVVRLQREGVLADDSPATPSFAGHPRREDRETLWGLAEHAQGAVLQSNRDKTSSRRWEQLSPKCRELRGQGPRSPRRISPRFWFELLSECNPRQPGTGTSLKKSQNPSFMSRTHTLQHRHRVGHPLLRHRPPYFDRWFRRDYFDSV